MERKSHGWTLVDGMTMDLGGENDTNPSPPTRKSSNS